MAPPEDDVGSFQEDIFSHFSEQEVYLQMQTRQPLVESPNGKFELSNQEIARYSRHLIMPEVALEGQKQLKAAKVLTVGTGGLGSPLALYLAAAGVGTIGIVDFDLGGGATQGPERLREAQRQKPQRRGQGARGSANQRERSRDLRGLRRDRRRHGQRPDPLSGERRVRPPG